MSIINDSLTNSSSYKIEFKHHPEYLYAFVGNAVDSLELSKKYWFEILDECEKKDYSKVLIDEDLEGTLTSSDAYQLSVTLAESKFKDKIVAFVDRRLEHQESNQFGELIYTNRGGRVKIFNDIDDAKKWLLEI